MQRLEVSGAVRPIYGSLGVKWLTPGNGTHGIGYMNTSASLINQMCVEKKTN